jgi:hypothetical protein
MIKAGQLKATIARALRLPDKRVNYPYRVALENGEVSKGKRGRGGASVTVADGAKVLIAVASSHMGGEVIEGIRDFSRLQLDYTAHNSWTANHSDERSRVTKNHKPDACIEREDGSWMLIECKVPQLQSLPPRHTFAEALTGLIEAARDRVFDTSHKIEVIFHGPEPKVDIEIELFSGPGRGYVEEAVYQLPDRPEIEAGEKASAFEVTVKIDNQAIYAIADLFRDQICEDQGFPLDTNTPWHRDAPVKSAVRGGLPRSKQS